MAEEDEEDLRRQIEALEVEEIKLDVQLAAAGVTSSTSRDLGLTPSTSCDPAVTSDPSCSGQSSSSTPTSRKSRGNKPHSSAQGDAHAQKQDAYITQLHAYNEIKDATQAVLGMLASHEQVTVRELHLKYLPDVKHV